MGGSSERKTIRSTRRIISDMRKDKISQIRSGRRRSRSIRKNRLIEHNVSRNVDKISSNVHYFVAFYAMRIAQKHTLSGPRCKFVSVRMWGRDKTQTTKTPKISIRRWRMKKHFIRCFITQRLRRNPINQMNSNEDAITPKTQGCLRSKF